MGTVEWWDRRLRAPATTFIELWNRAGSVAEWRLCALSPSSRPRLTIAVISPGFTRDTRRPVAGLRI
jgi:hypothetical protein